MFYQQYGYGKLHVMNRTHLHCKPRAIVLRVVPTLSCSALSVLCRGVGVGGAA